MRVLFYIARTYLGALLLTLFGLSVLVVTVHLIETAGRLSTVEGDVAGIALRLALYASAEYAWQVLPIAGLMGALIAGTLLARHGELLAMQAAGIRPWRQGAAFMSVALAAGACGVACGEYVVPRALVEVERMERQDLGVRPDRLSQFYTGRSHWYQDGDLILFLPAVDIKTMTFSDVVVYRYAKGLIEEIVEADELVHEASGWILRRARTHSAGDGEVRSDALLPLELSVAPRDLTDVAGNPKQMSSAAVSQLIERRTSAGFDTVAHRVELHQRFAYPLLTLWLVMLATPWVLDPSRNRSLSTTLGAGVVAIGVLLAVSHLFRLLALGRTVAPSVGAWGLAVVCLVLLPVSSGIYQRRRIRGALF